MEQKEKRDIRGVGRGLETGPGSKHLYTSVPRDTAETLALLGLVSLSLSLSGSAFPLS